MLNNSIKIAVFYALLVASQAKAAVTLTFEQVGDNVSATWSGHYLTPSQVSSDSFTSGYAIVGRNQFNFGDIRVFGGRSFENYSIARNHSTYIDMPLTQLYNGSYNGDTFGFFGGNLHWPSAVGLGTVFSPVGVMTFFSQTLESMGVAAFEHKLVYTGAGNVDGNRQIFFHTVPEPGVPALFALGAACLLTRHRKEFKKHNKTLHPTAGNAPV